MRTREGHNETKNKDNTKKGRKKERKKEKQEGNKEVKQKQGYGSKCIKKKGFFIGGIPGDRGLYKERRKEGRKEGMYPP